MNTPIELLLEKLHDITLNLKKAINNELPKEDIKLMEAHYNKYLAAIQLLDHHCDFNYKVSRLNIEKGRARYRMVNIRDHKSGLISKKNLYRFK